MKLTLFIWRQNSPTAAGRLVRYEVPGVSPEMSFLEMLDVLNDDLVLRDEEPVAFDHDCREGICGACSQVINGQPHGPRPRTTICQLHMRNFKEGDTIYIEPFRARAFPVIRDLVVDRSALDALIRAGGSISAHTGGVPDANAVLIPREDAEEAMDAAECIGCGACVAACPNGAAMLVAAGKIAHLAALPQGRVEASRRVCAMTEEMLRQGFGNCSNHYECEAACPKGIKARYIAKLNREFVTALTHGERRPA